MNERSTSGFQTVAAIGTMLVLIALVVPALPWLSYENPEVTSERATLDDRTLAAARITIPVSRGANGTQPEDHLILGEDRYRMGDIATLFDLELPFPAVYSRREFLVTGAQLSQIHPEGKQPTLAVLAAYDDDVEIPLREILAHSELVLPRPSLHESAAVWVELADLLDLLSIAIPVQTLLVDQGIDLPLHPEVATATEISIQQLAAVAGIMLPDSTPEASLSLSEVFSLAAIELPLEEITIPTLHLNLSELNRQARLGWDETTWAQIEGADLAVSEVLEEARVAVPLEPASVQRSALGLLDDYLLRVPGWFSLSLALALTVCMFTLFLPTLGRRWYLWFVAICSLPALIWLPAHIRSQNPAAWGSDILLGSLSLGYWLAWLGVIIIAIGSLGPYLLNRRT